MLNILKKKKNSYGYLELDTQLKTKNDIKCQEKDYIQDELDRKEYKNTIFYPSNKEWFSVVYSYNKSYIKPLIILDKLVSYLSTTYFNMSEDIIKRIYKRRRSNKTRYSADKIYLSRPELKHTNTNVTLMLYTYNKKKTSLERYTRKLLVLKRIKEKKYLNRLWSILKKRFFLYKKWKNVFININNSLINYLVFKFKSIYLKSYKIYINKLVFIRKGYKLERLIHSYAEKVSFNKLKFNRLLIAFKGLGLNSIIEKIYNKTLEIKLVELKSIHLNSDVFSSAVALKLRDRKNQAVKILRKAILQMTKIPDLHTIRTFDDNMEQIDEASLISNNIVETPCSVNLIDHLKNVEENNTLNNIKQQVVSGVRFEASGRLTRRLTAMRAVFKYRYVGSLKNLRSSLNNKPSTILRGNLKSNGQFIMIPSKTRNGAFGLKGWVSSHNLALNSLISQLVLPLIGLLVLYLCNILIKRVISNNSTKKQKNLLSGYWTGVNKLQAQRLRNKLRRDKGSTNLPTPHLLVAYL